MSLNIQYLTLINELLEKLEEEEVEMMATIARRIWLRWMTLMFRGDPSPTLPI